jgi:dTDP-4-amino-4,6-dideoxygalactose transaminase
VNEPIRLARPDVGEAELAAVAEVVATGMLTMGPKVGELECALAGACGTPVRMGHAQGPSLACRAFDG